MRWTTFTMLSAVAGTLVAVGSPPRPAFAVDGAVENPDNGHWYLLVTDANVLDWATCEATAVKQYGGYLATVTSAEEDKWLQDTLLSGLSETFLGGSDAANEGTWAWSNGEAWTYEPWAKGEPSDGKGAENYLVTGGPWGAEWADDEGSSTVTSKVLNYVVEWDTNPSAEVTDAPDAPTNLVASFAEGGGVTLSWTDASSGAAAETGFRIERRTGAYVFAHLATTAADAKEYVDHFLYPSTTFVYRVRAFNAIGDSAWSNEASATTSAQVAIPPLPGAPSQLVATAGGDGANAISWTDNSLDEVRFSLERAEGGETFKPFTITDTDVTALADQDLHPGWPCTYRVRALALQGPSPFSNPATAVQPSTLDIATTSGSLTDSPKAKKDKLTLGATYTSAAPLDPVANGLELQLGAVNAPVLVSIPAADAAWRVKTKKGVPSTATWKSAKGAAPKVTVVVDLVKHTLTATITGADFSSAPSSTVRLLVATGADGGAHAATWAEKKPGQLVFE